MHSLRIGVKAGFMRSRRWLLWGTVLLLFGVAWWFLRKGADPWMTEMRAKGEKFTFEELGIHGANPGDPNEGQFESAVAAIRSPYSPGGIEWLSFTSPGRARALWKDADLPFPGALDVGWTNFNREYGAAQPNLQQIRKLTLQPIRIRATDYRQVMGPYPNYVAYRVGAQWMAGDVTYHLRRSDYAEAQESLKALVRLSHMFSEDYTLVSQMIRVAITGLGISAVWTGLEAPGWDERSLAELQRELEAIFILEKIPATVELERAKGLVLFELARTNNPRAIRARFTFSPTPTPTNAFNDFVEDYMKTPLWRFFMQGGDKLFYVQNMQANLETARNAQKHKSWSQWSNELAQVDSRLSDEGPNKIIGSPSAQPPTNLFSVVEGLRTQISTLAGGRFDRAYQILMRNLTLRNLAVAHIAVRRHQLRHGKAPANLDNLVPEFVLSVPVDYMDGKPLRYRLNADGTFLLYSVGEDGIDGGGDGTTTRADGKYGWFSDGRDYVWPKAVPPSAENRPRPVTTVAAPPKPVILPKSVLPMLALDGVPLLDAMRTVAKQGGLQLEVDPSLQDPSAKLPKITVRYTNVGVGDALQSIASTHGLVIEGGSKTNSILVRSK